MYIYFFHYSKEMKNDLIFVNKKLLLFYPSVCIFEQLKRWNVHLRKHLLNFDDGFKKKKVFDEFKIIKIIMNF